MTLIDTIRRAVAIDTLLSGRTGVVMIGNPGCGKSAILNALGGSFTSGYSNVNGLTQTVATQNVTLQKRHFRLVDIPGIQDSAGGDYAYGAETATDRHLGMLHDALNDGHAYVIFFVITPRNGRIDPGDLALMQLVLSSMDEGPLVGLIITQIKKAHMDRVESGDYYDGILQVLRNNKADLRFLKQSGPLVLRGHEDDFTREERLSIQNYILEFVPTQVKIRDMVASALQVLFQAFKEIVAHNAMLLLTGAYSN